MTGFRPAAGGVTARFSPIESALIRSLVTQIAALVGEDPGQQETGTAPARGGEPPGGQAPGSPEDPDDLASLLGQLERPAQPPDDPVLARLLPDAYRDDPEAAGEFRRYTEDSLREAKAGTARLVLATLPEGGGQVQLGGEEAQAWLRALNDVRLALGVRLEITEDFEDQLERLPADDPRAGYFEIYDWLTYVQDSLVRALS